MEIVDLAMRWLHVGTAIVLLGGAAFQRFALLPAAQSLPDDAHQNLRAEVVRRWKRFVTIGILILLGTGFYNWFQTSKAPGFKSTYEMLIGIKFLLALGVFFIASVLVGRSPKFESWRKNAGSTLGVLLMLGFVIVLISGYIKVAHQSAWRQAATQSAAP
jgi:uncharacterized membrane protein